MKALAIISDGRALCVPCARAEAGEYLHLYTMSCRSEPAEADALCSECGQAIGRPEAEDAAVRWAAEVEP